MAAAAKIGPLGEELVARFLVKKGYTVLDRNFWKPWGELDLVAKKKGKLHFVEVKTFSSRVSDETISRETPEKLANSKDKMRPEDNVTPEKIRRLGRIIQTYLHTKGVSDETKWEFAVATVLLDIETRRAKISLLENIIL